MGGSPTPIPSPEGEGLEETKAVAGWVLDQILVMLHPFMPFVTEELWHALADPTHPRPYELIVAKWPEPGAAVDPEAKREIDFLIAAISSIRSQRLDTGFKPGDVIPVSITEAPASKLSLFNKYGAILRRMARVRPATIEVNESDGTHVWSVTHADRYELVEEVSNTGFVTAQFIIEDVLLVAFTQGFIDLAAEKSRLAKAREASANERDSLAKRLANPAFVAKAAPQAVDKARADHASHAAEAERLAAALARLG